MVRPCLSLDISQMRGQINFMLLRIDSVSEDTRRLSRQLNLMLLLLDSVDLAETIGVGLAASKIRDFVQGTGDGGQMAEEFELCGFPLGMAGHDPLPATTTFERRIPSQI
jgi:hypothetical protein